MAALARQLGDCEAARRKFEDLESTHNTVQRRLQQARANDDRFNAHPAPPPQPDSPSGRKGERIRYIPPTGFG